MNKKAKLRNDDPKAKEITRKIGEIICLDNQPFSVVEHKGFNRLINHLEPRYEIPKRKYFTTVEAPKLYDQTKLVVYNLVNSAEHVSITTDLWTSTANDDYMSVTAHFFLESDWKHICLECAIQKSAIQLKRLETSRKRCYRNGVLKRKYMLL